MHQVSEKIKNEPFLKQPNKMMGNPEKRNRNLYCQYHQDHRHTTEDFDEVAVRTFKVGLLSEHSLRKSLTGKPVTSLRQLMDRVDKYKRIEDDQQ